MRTPQPDYRKAAFPAGLRRIVAHVELCVLALTIQRAAKIAAEVPWSQLAPSWSA